MTSSKQVQNFGNNVSFTPATIAEPKNEAELLQLLGKHRNESIRVVASRHAWSDAIVTDGLLINVGNFNHVRINADRQTVSVGAGCLVKHLVQELKPNGLTLPSLGLIDEQTVAGATATGTHGSGKHSLSHYVRRVRVAHFDPQTDEPIISEIDTGDDLLAARCSLGLLGVIVELELETRDVYQVHEYSQRHESIESMLETEKAFPLQQFFLIPWGWHLLGQHRSETDRPRSRTAGLYGAYWHWGIDWGLHLIVFLLVRILRFNAAIRGFFRFVLPLIVVRNWHVTDDSHALLTMEHELFRHIEIELFVTRPQLKAALEHAQQAICVFGGQQTAGELKKAIPEQHHGSYCHHYPICVRRVLADDTLISMSSPLTSGNSPPNTEAGADEGTHDDWYAISFISYERPDRRAGFLAFAEFLASSMRTRFGARCHWGKHNPLDRNANEQLYPHLKTFRQVVQKFDPHSRFSNDWLRRVLLKTSSENESSNRRTNQTPQG